MKWRDFAENWIFRHNITKPAVFLRPMRGFPFLILFAAGLTVVSSCLKPPPSYPIEPKIEFKSLSKTVIEEYDTLTITVNFTDGDGDLGPKGLIPSCTANICDLVSDSSCLNDPAWSLYLLDHRDSCLSLLNIPYIEPKGKYDDLSGEIIFSTPPVSCKVRDCSPLPGCPDDTVVYTVLFKDRAGHWSNGIQTPPVIIHCR